MAIAIVPLPLEVTNFVFAGRCIAASAESQPQPDLLCSEQLPDRVGPVVRILCYLLLVNRSVCKLCQRWCIVIDNFFWNDIAPGPTFFRDLTECPPLVVLEHALESTCFGEILPEYLVILEDFDQD